MAASPGDAPGAAYVSSKHGLIGLTRNIAATYGADGIRCVAIAPGGVNTGISIGGVPSERGFAALNRTLPANLRTGEPDEIASAAAFLASDEASFVNGAVLTSTAAGSRTDNGIDRGERYSVYASLPPPQASHFRRDSGANHW